MINFINTGLDERILKSMPTEDVSEDLEKAFNRAGLVQKEVQVKGKNGQVFTRKQWVKAGEEQKTDKPTKPEDQNATKPTKTGEDTKTPHKVTGKNMSELVGNLKQQGFEMDSADQSSPQDSVTLYKDKKEYTATFNKYHDGGVEVVNIKPSSSDKSSTANGGGGGDTTTSSKTMTQQHWTKVGTSQEAKSQIAQMLASGKSREDCMAEFEKQGVTWKKSDHEGINWMRAAMAMNKHLTSGTQGSETNKPKSEEKSENNQSSSNSQKKFKNGYIDKDGDLVADDKSDLSDLVSEITDTDMFEQKDYATEELEKNPEYKGAYIASMGIEKASQNKDGSISVTAYVEGYIEDDRDGSSEDFDTYVTFNIPVMNKHLTSGGTQDNTTTNDTKSDIDSSVKGAYDFLKKITENLKSDESTTKIIPGVGMVFAKLDSNGNALFELPSYSSHPPVIRESDGDFPEFLKKVQKGIDGAKNTRALGKPEINRRKQFITDTNKRIRTEANDLAKKYESELNNSDIYFEKEGKTVSKSSDGTWISFPTDSNGKLDFSQKHGNGYPSVVYAFGAYHGLDKNIMKDRLYYTFKVDMKGNDPEYSESTLNSIKPVTNTKTTSSSFNKKLLSEMNDLATDAGSDYSKGKRWTGSKTLSNGDKVKIELDSDSSKKTVEYYSESLGKTLKFSGVSDLHVDHVLSISMVSSLYKDDSALNQDTMKDLTKKFSDIPTFSVS